MSLLDRVGFKRFEAQSPPLSCRRLYEKSERISRGLDPYAEDGFSLVNGKRVLLADYKARKNIELREFITARAWKAD